MAKNTSVDKDIKINLFDFYFDNSLQPKKDKLMILMPHRTEYFKTVIDLHRYKHTMQHNPGDII